MLTDNIKNNFSAFFECLEISVYQKAQESLESVNDKFEMKLWLQRNYKVSNEIKKEAEKIVNESYDEEAVAYIVTAHESNWDFSTSKSAFDIMKQKLAKDLSNEYDKRYMLRKRLIEYISCRLNIAANILPEESWESWSRQNHNFLLNMGYTKDIDFTNTTTEICNDLHEAATFLDDLLHEAEEGPDEPEDEEEYSEFIDDDF